MANRFAMLALLAALLGCGDDSGGGTAGTTPTGGPKTAQGATSWSALFPNGLIDAAGNAVDLSVLDGKIVGVYFSAHWCPPCRGFTPKLVSFRNQNASDFEVVFVSSDKSEAEMKGYMAETGMKWPAVKYGSAPANSLKQRFKVSGIPTLVILSPAGKIINPNGRSDVQNSPDTCLDTWKKKAGN